MHACTATYVQYKCVYCACVEYQLLPGDELDELLDYIMIRE